MSSRLFDRPLRLTLPDPCATAALAARVATLVRRGDAILLEGPLGAGKTTFARSFLRAASGEPMLDVPSPSYTLVQSYETRVGPVHHFDLWRLQQPGELAELGWQEARADIVLVEWPDRLGEDWREGSLPDALRVSLAFAAGEARLADVSGWPDRLDRLA
jgi:tRNA threonylcarbamoyladenosine biosynthesis protein TsaE